jgi:hypothetical protein
MLWPLQKICFCTAGLTAESEHAIWAIAWIYIGWKDEKWPTMGRVWFLAMGHKANFVMHWGSQQRGSPLLRLLRLLSHNAESGSPLWATAQRLVPADEPQHRVWFPTMGHSVKVGSRYWATTPSLVPHYGPQRKGWSPLLSHSTEFGSPLWAIA